MTVRSTYVSLRNEMLQDLNSAAQVDIIILFLHSDMAAEGYDDCEGNMIRQVGDWLPQTK